MTTWIPETRPHAWLMPNNYVGELGNNRPRRGIWPELSGFLDQLGVPWAIYSNCNVDTLARDLARMPSLRLLGMFPHTAHYEVITLLERTG